MNGLFLKRLEELSKPTWVEGFRGIKRGFEEESLRVNSKGYLASTPHPVALGASLTHPLITTDYSEALMEFITPPSAHLTEPFQILKTLRAYTAQNLEEEVLWGASMPCLLPPSDEIPIAYYGTSNAGRLKERYRKGLGYRYGRSMQTIAGFHYNFSLPHAFWESYHTLLGSDQLLQDFISDQYLGLIRNYLRYGWLLPLLFGASPAVDTSFLKEGAECLSAWDKNTWIAPFSTSLRLSEIGYGNRGQSKFQVSYNALDTYIKDLKTAVQTPAPQYAGATKDAIQLNQNFLQIENEHYALVRPKRSLDPDQRILTALSKKGVEYIEVRSVDINPFAELGIEPETIYFLDAFLIFCLLMESPPIEASEQERIDFNQKEIVIKGRTPGLQLQTEKGVSTVLDYASEILESLRKVADRLDNAYNVAIFKGAIDKADTQLRNPDQLPSARVLQEMKNHQASYFEFALRHSLAHHDYFKNLSLSSSEIAYYTDKAHSSLREQARLESSSEQPFSEYLKKFLIL